MNYLLKSNRPKKTSRLVMGVVFVFLFLGGVHWFFPSFFPSLFYFVGYPIWKGESKAGEILTSDGSFFTSKESLLAENQNLKKQIDAMQNDLNEIALLREENSEMKNILGQGVYEKKIVANILVKPNFSPYDTLILDSGTEDGVLVGDRIVSGKSIVLGEIIESHPHFSKAKLYSSPGTEVNVTIGSEHIQTVATGRGGGNFEAKLPQGVVVSIGDIVTMPSVNPLLFAFVESIDVRDTDSFQTLFFKNPVTISSLTSVLIVQNPLVGN